jgi:hypothetical protein
MSLKVPLSFRFRAQKIYLTSRFSGFGQLKIALTIGLFLKGASMDDNDDEWCEKTPSRPTASTARYPAAFRKMFGTQILKDGSRTSRRAGVKAKNPDVQVRGGSRARQQLNGEILTSPRARSAGENALSW